MTHIVLLSSSKVNWIITVKKSRSNYIYGRWIRDNAEVKLTETLIIEQEGSNLELGFKSYKIEHIRWNYRHKECTIYVSDPKEY